MIAVAQEHSARSRLNVEGLRVEMASSGLDVIDDVSFTLTAGNILGVVGESGSGKTTAALALLGHARRGLSIASGSVELDGVNILDLDHKRLREIRGAAISYVPQDPGSALNPALRVGVQIREVLTAHGTPKEHTSARVLELLDSVHLDRTGDIANRFPHQLSGGQQQRIAIAMAFACGPSVIVLDEPTTGLDVSTQRRILETVRGLCDAHGVAGVYVSHDLSVVAGLASSVAVMYGGRIVEIGSATDVLERPLHPYTRGLVAAIPSPERAHTLVGIEGRPPRPGRRPNGCFFAPRCESARPICRGSEPPAIAYENRLVKCVRIAELPRTPVLLRPAKPTSGRGEPLLSVEKLSARYGRRLVLKDITFDVRSRGCTAVVGESGSGKTTLARCLVGMHGGWAGVVRYEGTELAQYARSRPRPLLRQIQYVFQNPYASLNPRKTIEQIIRQPLDDHFGLSARDARPRILKALDDVALDGHILHYYPVQLSGGDRQRIAIARAIVVDPSILVCDEVTSALDVSVQAVIVELLRQQQHERELGLVFITHNLALVRSIAQQVVVVQDGIAVEVGPVEQLFTAPKHPYTKALIRDIPRLEAAAGPIALPRV